MRTLVLATLVVVGCADTSLYVHEKYLAHVHSHVVYPQGQSEATLEIQNRGARSLALEAPLYIFSDRPSDQRCPSPDLAITDSMPIGPRATVQLPIIGEDSGKFVGVCIWVQAANDGSVYARTVWSDNRLR